MLIIVQQTNMFKTFGRIVQVYNNGQYKVKILGTQYSDKTIIPLEDNFIIKSIHDENT